MHFDFTVSIGQIIIAGAIIGLIWRIEVFSSWFMFEHEMLIEWYCKEHNLRPDELMTRKMRKGLISIFFGVKK